MDYRNGEDSGKHSTVYRFFSCTGFSVMHHEHDDPHETTSDGNGGGGHSNGNAPGPDTVKWWKKWHAVRVNGMACKNPLFVQADDFFYSGLHIPGDTQNSNGYGYRVNPVTVYQIPGLNTLGLSMMRIDYGLYGANPPHTHPRATEILTVLEGTLQVGFITSDPQNRLITKVLQRGDVFVFPVGLVHFQRNMGLSNATAIAALSSQNPGVISVTNSIFGSTPPISTEILAQAFQVDEKTVHLLKKKLIHV
ncbi:hypothetical protein SSX86_005682 [Deinandra increscens subsp. villosa]|uniref:Germin-like protein n=1 Tax=Deinandra increscens subsp. villosa TaxID=3103831 RepID=A0AAP0DQD2_9ASTR